MGYVMACMGVWGYMVVFRSLIDSLHGYRAQVFIWDCMGVKGCVGSLHAYRLI